MRHAIDEDLDRLEDLLQALRGVAGLRERRRGSFSRGSRAFLHFHEDGGRLYVDARLADRFRRMPVTTAEERTTFLERVRAVLADDQSL